jgi:hypothetical protein
MSRWLLPLQVDLDLDMAKALAFCSGRHARLGRKATIFKELNDDIMAMIVRDTFLAHSHNKKLAADTLPLLFPLAQVLL